MITRVPAPDRQIQPADERQQAIDTDDLLVLGRTERQRGVQMKPHAAVRAGGEFRSRIPFPFRGVKRDKVPDENVDAQAGTSLDQRAQEWTKLLRQAVIRASGSSDQPGFTVNVPPDDIDEILRLQQRLPQGREISGSIVQNRHTPRFAPPPDGVAGDQDR